MKPSQAFIEKSSLNKNPLLEFKKRFAQATKSDPQSADHMILATCYKKKPSARTLLLKGVDKVGFRFFTNYTSRKAFELKASPNGALVFNWKSVELQIRVEGKISKLSRTESAKYFSSRPRGSQIASWISPQSKVVPSRDFLLKRAKEFENLYQDKEIPLPPFWGGFILKPTYFEFMFMRNFRLHDRFSYTKKSSRWKIERLGP